MSGLGVIAAELDRVCELCGTITECRPYGPNDEQVCYDCGMKDEAAAFRKMMRYVHGIEIAEDHPGLERIRARIKEQLAFRKLNSST
jgi:hypothetical protein